MRFSRGAPPSHQAPSAASAVRPRGWFLADMERALQSLTVLAARSGIIRGADSCGQRKLSTSEKKRNRRVSIRSRILFS